VDRPSDADLFARVLAKTCEYLDFPAVVGHETPFLDHVAADFTSLGAQVERPRNLAVITLAKPGPVFLAHGDRHGAVIAEDGAAIYAAYAVKNDKYGEVASPSETFVRTLGERHAGEEVFAYDRKTGGRIAYGDVTGAEFDGQGRAVLKLTGMPRLPAGTPIAFSRSLDRSQAGYLAGQLDNPASIAALRVAAEFGLGGTVLVTAEEEIGRSAGHVLEWAQAGRLNGTKDLIVCDTTPFDDGAAALAGAVILRRRDATASFNAEQVSRLEAAAGTVGAPIIFKDSFIERENDARARRGQPAKSMGLTELGKIIAASKGDYTGATLQLPTFNYHTNRESTTPRALTAFVKTLLALTE
jgi:putative aminopeptidase FrvX